MSTCIDVISAQETSAATHASCLKMILMVLSICMNQLYCPPWNTIVSIMTVKLSMTTTGIDALNAEVSDRLAPTSLMMKVLKAPQPLRKVFITGCNLRSASASLIATVLKVTEIQTTYTTLTAPVTMVSPMVKTNCATHAANWSLLIASPALPRKVALVSMTAMRVKTRTI